MKKLLAIALSAILDAAAWPGRGRFGGGYKIGVFEPITCVNAGEG